MLYDNNNQFNLNRRCNSSGTLLGYGIDIAMNIKLDDIPNILTKTFLGDKEYINLCTDLIKLELLRKWGLEDDAKKQS